MDRKTLEILYKTYYQTIHSYLLSLTHSESMANDLTQEAFLKYYNSAEKFRGECSELTMLYKIAKNLYLNHIRSEKRLTPLYEEMECHGPSFEKMLEDGDRAMQIHEILHKLPDPYKEVFSLHIFGELTFSKIAFLFGKSESWAKMTYYRAKAKIAAELKEDA